jgi:hypothetical protein
MSLRIHIGHGEHPAAKQGGDLSGVYFVVFHLSTVYRLHVQGVTRNELDADAAAQVCHPVPGEDALHCQHHVLPVGLEHIGEGLCRSRHVPVCKNRSFMVHDADVHCPCVQIDTAVKSMVFGGESHKASSLGNRFLAESIIPFFLEGALMSIELLEQSPQRPNGTAGYGWKGTSACGHGRRRCSTLCWASGSSPQMVIE